ncbi:MAG: ECF transporter S component [Anaerotignum sp.]|nr:ECF transporter S component [Anaerotignum sp.]
MKKTIDSKKLTISGMFLALALVMPFLTGQIPQIGSMLCPMHFPVLLCGFFCGGGMGLLVGFIAPLLRSFLFGMPMMFPAAVCMAFEMAVYGLAAGYLYRLLPKQKWAVYVSLVCAMIFGRIVWGIVMLVCVGAEFGMAAFVAGAVTTALPGIILQLVLIPAIVIVMEKYVEG